MQGCISNSVTPEDCIVKGITVTKIRKGTAFDIVIYDGKTDFYYINRGLERGWDISVLEEKPLSSREIIEVTKIKENIITSILRDMLENNLIELTNTNTYKRK